MANTREIKEISKRIKRDVIQLTSKNTGHPGGAIGAADIIAELYFNRLHHRPSQPDWEDRDRFVLSNGHICTALYSAMARSGYFPIEELWTFRKLNSRLQGHPSRHDLPGLETSAGPLGQGLSIANGMALANRLRGSDAKIYCLVGDGEIQEGQVWEAAMTAAHHHLDKIALIVSWNDIQIDGHVKDVMNIEPIAEKFKAFGWHTLEIDGNEVNEIKMAFDQFEQNTGAPTAIIAKTVIGKGVSFMEDEAIWHGKAPSAEEATRALEEIGTSSFGTELITER
ncbi:transketolase [Gracilibacillus salitolerans]|uniref:Transketolase n=1 Tax=Gracilibacillus salitolerans TaxID=2663022 RepID=A0A5Q2TP79_9BACI|nr:transketolase [Gracilibacillus salitolerans]QGH35912.1 transketolase [Gracilibacillus salitolerans]